MSTFKITCIQTIVWIFPEISASLTLLTIITTNEMFQLVGEAYSAYYLSGWLKFMSKRYINPFGKFNWMMRNIPRFAKPVIVSGLDMIH